MYTNDGFPSNLVEMSRKNNKSTKKLSKKKQKIKKRNFATLKEKLQLIDALASGNRCIAVAVAVAVAVTVVVSLNIILLIGCKNAHIELRR